MMLMKKNGVSLYPATKSERFSDSSLMVSGKYSNRRNLFPRQKPSASLESVEPRPECLLYIKAEKNAARRIVAARAHALGIQGCIKPRI
jgi:hypothetical protein